MIKPIKIATYLYTLSSVSKSSKKPKMPFMVTLGDWAKNGCGDSSLLGQNGSVCERKNIFRVGSECK